MRPSTENMNRLSLYLGHRTKLIENLKRQLNQPTSKPNNTSLQTTKKPDLKSVDIRSMLAKVQSGALLPPTSTTKVHALRNFFINRLWAIDANWRRIRNVRYRRLTPNGVKAVFFAFFVHSARLLRSTSGLWLAADRRY